MCFRQLMPYWRAANSGDKERQERSVRFSGEPIKVHMQPAVMTDATKHYVISRSRSFVTAMPLRSLAQLG
jgi:hypothetical protein